MTTTARVLRSRTLVRDNYNGTTCLFQGQDAVTGERIPRCGVYQGKVFMTITDSTYLGLRDLSELTCDDCRSTVHP